MQYFAQFAKMPTGEVGVVLHATLKTRRVTLGTERPDKKGGRESLSMFADALVFKDGTVCDDREKGPWWHGPWVHFEDEAWQDFDTSFPAKVAEQYPIVPFTPNGP